LAILYCDTEEEKLDYVRGEERVPLLCIVKGKAIPLKTLRVPGG
jgi:hypothetical protein